VTAAEIEEWVPVGAVPGQPGHVGRKDQTDLAEGDAGDEILEALPAGGARAAEAEVGIDDLDVGIMPAELLGPLVQRVLQPQALLVGDHLVRRGLAHIDDRAAAEVMCRDEVRAHDLSPGAPRRGLR
jgi:hypothetical protein